MLEYDAVVLGSVDCGAVGLRNCWTMELLEYDDV